MDDHDSKTGTDRSQLWQDYNDKQLTRAHPRPLLIEAADLAGPGDGRVALELGCGAGIEAAELAARGWNVTAIDGAPGTSRRVDHVVSARAPHLRSAIRVVELGLEAAVDSLPAADLIYSGYTLPYVRPDAFPRLWSAVTGSLRPGAILAVQLFGDRDSYVGEPDWNFHTKAETIELLRGLELVTFTEQDEDGMAAGGPKHWHVFHVIARRPW